MDLPDIVLYFAVAALGGAVNAVAGGGTFLTFPILIMNGMGSIAANVTSTIALWPGSVASAMAYKHQREIDRKKFIPFIIISILGSALGTAILLLTPETTFKGLVPWLLLVATLIFTFGALPRRGNNKAATSSNPAILQPALITSALRWEGLVLQFVIAVYGGYFGAGQGVLMLAALQFMGFTHIHQMNALKTVLGSSINAVAVLVFLFSGKVVWDVAVVMIAGAILGGYFGARWSLRVSPQIIRLLVSVTGFAMSAYFFLYGV